MKCHQAGCDREATHMPVIEIPAKGYSIDHHTPIQMFTGYQGCRDHANSHVDPKTVFDNSEIKAVVRGAVAALGKAEPDFERVEVSVRRLTHVSVQDYLRLKK